MRNHCEALSIAILLILVGCVSPPPPRPPLPTAEDFTAHEMCLRKFVCGRIAGESSKPSAVKLESIAYAATAVCNPPLQAIERRHNVYGGGMSAINDEFEHEQLEDSDTRQHAFALALDDINECHLGKW